MLTVIAFLKTAAARDAAERSGNSEISDFSADDGEGRVALDFRGAYTVLEVKALLADLEAVQAAYDLARRTTFSVEPRFTGGAELCRYALVERDHLTGDSKVVGLYAVAESARLAARDKVNAGLGVAS